MLDTQSGALSLISHSPTGELGNGGSWRPDIDAAGRFVAFESRASNLVPDDTNSVSDIFLYDRETGQIERISLRNN